jgi:hypothetical protein
VGGAESVLDDMCQSLPAMAARLKSKLRCGCYQNQTEKMCAVAADIAREDPSAHGGGVRVDEEVGQRIMFGSLKMRYARA